jgi:hypothetical protein
VRRLILLLIGVVAVAAIGIAQETGPFKVLKAGQGRWRRWVGLYLR